MKILITGDWHIPYHDPRAVDALLAYAARFAPDVLAVHGDVVDFEAFGRFLKDPRKVADPQRELRKAREILTELERATGGAQRIFGIGNHEHRLTNLILRNAPALACLESLDLPELLGVRGWHIIPHEGFRKVGNLIIQHGVSYGPTTNAKNIARFGGWNIVQGHSHRLSQKFVRSLHGIHSAVEAGCLCKLDGLQYCQSPDWQQGFATFEGGHLRLHLIEKGKVLA